MAKITLLTIGFFLCSYRLSSFMLFLLVMISLRDQISSICHHSFTLPPPKPLTNLRCRCTISGPISPHLYLPLESHPLLSLICSLGRIPTLNPDNILISIFPVCSIPLLTSMPKSPAIHLLSGGHVQTLTVAWVKYGALNQEPGLDGREIPGGIDESQCKGMIQGKSPHGKTRCLIVCPTRVPGTRVRIHK